MSEIVRVASTSHTTAVAGAIAGIIRDRREAEVQAIGAGAVNQSVKAIAIARAYLRQDGIDIACVPSFVDLEVDGQVRTAIRLHVQTVPTSG